MEKSMEEMLYALQCFEYKSLDLCKIQGNGLSEPWWRINWMSTIGGEKFRFCQVVMRMEGSGIYFDTREEAIEYAKEKVIELFKLAAKRPILKANDYDWRLREWEE